MAAIPIEHTWASDYRRQRDAQGVSPVNLGISARHYYKTRQDSQSHPVIPVAFGIINYHRAAPDENESTVFRNFSLNQEPIQRFRRQMYMLSRVTSFFTTVGISAPRIFALVDWGKFKDEKSLLLSEAIQAGADYVRSLHPGKDLYGGVPEAIPVDSNCPALKFSDHIQSLLGRNHVMFDLIHAPFTHPLGTQVTFFLASNSWDAYCLYVGAVIDQRGLRDEKGTSDEKLRKANLLPSAKEIADSANQWLHADLRCTPNEVPSIIDAGKLLRNSFVHHGGQPKEELRKLIERDIFSQQLMRILPDGEFEVVLPMGNKIHQVLTSKVELIQSKADQSSR